MDSDMFFNELLLENKHPNRCYKCGSSNKAVDLCGSHKKQLIHFNRVEKLRQKRKIGVHSSKLQNFAINSPVNVC
jgi:hypothetical protein